jgi:predicted nucleic acid-binding protein
MNNIFFIDSNIFIYSKINNQADIRYFKSKKLLEEISGDVIISTQVLNEYYNVLTKHNIEHKLIIDSIYLILKNISLKYITLETIELCWKLREVYKYSYYDSLILASAIENNCNILYSEDFQDGQLINNKLRIINPFNKF